MKKLNVKKLKNIIVDVFDVDIEDIDVEVDAEYDIYINIYNYCKLYGYYEDNKIDLSFTEINCEYFYTTDDIRDLADKLEKIEENYN